MLVRFCDIKFANASLNISSRKTCAPGRPGASMSTTGLAMLRVCVCMLSFTSPELFTQVKSLVLKQPTDIYIEAIASAGRHG